MKHILELSLYPEQAFNNELLKKSIAKNLKINPENINYIRFLKRSIDARRKKIIVNITAEIFVNETPGERYILPLNLKYVKNKPEVIIIGAGPAGLFAALRIIEHGLKPVIIERGKRVDDRIHDIENFIFRLSFDKESNFCYGEGGAGTFSDGKLYTRSKKRGNHYRVLEILYLHGADESILYDSHPHIGSDKLPGIIKKIRHTIENAGGEFYFSSKLTDIIINESKIQKITTENKSFSGLAYILATGHSARDVYNLLINKNILIESKPFAAGVRIEHPQELINEIQYHGNKDEYLPPAYYMVAEQVNDRGVYSFCMCPGGEIVPAMTNNNEIVVNGMSNSNRNSPYANAGFVVQIKPEDYLKYGSKMGALILQQKLERLAFENSSKDFKAPAQRVTDFLKNKTSSVLPSCSYKLGIVTSPLHEWLPDFIKNSIKEALLRINKKIKGFISDEALLVGVESRTSSPIRIPRNPETGYHVNITNLYPAGEGSGYSGGIVSSAVDGMNIADKIFENLNNAFF